MMFGCRWVLSTLFLPCAFAAGRCRIEVVERGSGWPVPLVELRTTHQLRFVSDNNGVIALDSPELLEREIWFDVIGHGYDVPKDGFGMRGVRLTPQTGGTLKVQVDRRMVAKRLGRITGTGLFAESQKLGLEHDWKESGVFGCDSVQNALYRGKMFWAWGDTTMPHYPLGIFDATCATTAPSPLPSLKPPVQLRFDYFRDDRGRPRGVARMPGEGPTWLTGYVVLPDKNGQDRLVSTYLKVKPPMELYEIGLALWSDSNAGFEPLRTIWTKSEERPKPPTTLQGHPAFWKDAEGREWVLFGNPLPTARCPRSFEAWQDPARWESLHPPETLKSVDGAPVKLHSGHIAWSEFRHRWVTIFLESFGKPSAFGELWYAEADSPLEAWGPAVKILTHENYTFYNPRIHSEFTGVDSSVLLFEGTYTAEFADHAFPTPRYNYNQILYRLDLNDPALRRAQQ